MDTPIQSLYKALRLPAAPPKVRRCTTLAEAWARCTNGSWMLQVVRLLSGGEFSDARRPLVLAACECAEVVLPSFEARRPGEGRPRAAIELARRWALGDASVTPQAVEAACSAAWYIDWPTGGDQDATDIGTAIRWSTTDTTGGCLEWPAVSARNPSWYCCDDIVRRHFPDLLQLVLSCDNAKIRLLAITSLGEPASDRPAVRAAAVLALKPPAPKRKR